MRELAIGIVWYTDLFIISFLLLYNFLHVLFLWASFEDTRYWISRPLWEARERLQQSAFLPSITLLVPAYNEEVTIVESLRSLLRLEYPCLKL